MLGDPSDFQSIHRLVTLKIIEPCCHFNLSCTSDTCATPSARVWRPDDGRSGHILPSQPLLQPRSYNSFRRSSIRTHSYICSTCSTYSTYSIYSIYSICSTCRPHHNRSFRSYVTIPIVPYKSFAFIFRSLTSCIACSGVMFIKSAFLIRLMIVRVAGSSGA